MSVDALFVEPGAPRLGDIVTPRSERVDPQSLAGDTPYISLEHIESDAHRLTGSGSASEVRSAKTPFKEGDVLYGRLRPYLNKVCIAPFDGVCTTEILVLPTPRGLDASYLLRFLSQPAVVDYASHKATGDLPRVAFRDLGELRIPVPLPEQQRRVVDHIDAVSSGVGDLTMATARADHLLMQATDSLLVTACAGDLTADWREDHPDVEDADELLERIWKERLARFEVEREAAKAESRNSRYKKPAQMSAVDPSELPELPSTWTYTRLGNLGEVVRGASPRPAGDPRYFGGSIPWITVGALTNGESPYLDSVSETLTEEGAQRSRFVPEQTLLLTNSGATLGVPRITKIGGCINDGSVAIFEIPYVSQLYLYYFLRTQTAALRGIDQGAAQPNLNTGIVKSILVPLPPVHEQQVIVDRLNARLKTATDARARIERARQLADQAFRGATVRAFQSASVANRDT